MWNSCGIQGQGAPYDQMGLHYFKACVPSKAPSTSSSHLPSRSTRNARSFRLLKEAAVALPMAPPEQQRPRNPIKAAPGESGLAFKTCTIEGEGEKIYLGLGRVGTPVTYSYTDTGKEIVGMISDGPRGGSTAPLSSVTGLGWLQWRPQLLPMPRQDPFSGHTTSQVRVEE
ncbi:hypothetical protein SEVIR_1G363732v4 [Setaria viridis]